jgi:Holliday junction resolvasome RuvABC ATP-dependent DNA helicase subunit
MLSFLVSMSQRYPNKDLPVFLCTELVYIQDATPTFLLSGDLGAGKRTLALHLAKRLGYSIISVNGWEMAGDLYKLLALQ